MSKNSYLRRNGDSPVYQFLMRVPLKPELNSKRGEGACNLLISFIWSLDFFKTWCHVCLFIGLEC
ncbi:MAG: hypothetical protein ABSD90_17485, partial [Methylocystis sp.]